MNKYMNDSQVLSAQNTAYALREAELKIEEQCIAGELHWDFWESAVKETESAVRYAVSLGATYKDLPAI